MEQRRQDAEYRKQQKELEKFEQEKLKKQQAENSATYGQVSDMDDISFAK